MTTVECGDTRPIASDSIPAENWVAKDLRAVFESELDPVRRQIIKFSVEFG
jgi:hypothetical protein